MQSRIELKEVIRDIMAASSESLIAKLDEIKREVVKVERTDSESTVGDRLMPTDLASVIAAQTSELSLILSDVQGKVIEGVSTHIEQRLSQLQLELARNMHNLKGAPHPKPRGLCPPGEPVREALCLTFIDGLHDTALGRVSC